MSDSQSTNHAGPDDLSAGDCTPWLTVRVLAESLYCPRAGLIAFEEQTEDRGEEFDSGPRLDYLPDFSVELIELALQATWNDIWRALTFTPPVVLVVGVLSFAIDARLALALVPATVWLVRRIVRQLRNVAELSRRLRAARAATPVEPDPRSTETLPVNWWNLLAAGFTPVEYEDAHADPAWKLAGRPWRVLHKGSLRIPIFRKRRGKLEVRPQLRARMTAYCHLVERAEGGEAPYGVVLFGDGYDGVAVPATINNARFFHEATAGGRRLAAASLAGEPPPDPPRDSRNCGKCHLGLPRVYGRGAADTWLGGEPVPPYLTQGRDRKYYHSPCGDRFAWVPPHDQATEKGLTD